MFIENKYDRYVVARWCYLMGHTFLSDIEYDKLDKEFKEEFPDSPYSKRHYPLDECPKELLEKYGLSELICNPVMGYMAESIYSINNEEEFKQTLMHLKEKSRLSFKIDGWNTRVSYFKGHLVKVETRGRAGNNLDINNIADMFPKTIPIMSRVAVTGELSIPNKLWDIFKGITGNNDQRASVRTALAKNACEYLSFMAFNIYIEDNNDVSDQYELLKELGFETPRFIWVDSYDKLLEGIKYMSYINRGYTHLTDGLVLENSSFQYAIRLGAWEEQSMHSYVTGYEEDQGMYGTFLKVLCYPITVDGKTFTKISINNIANIAENQLRVGYPIAFNLRSAANVVLDVTETDKLRRLYSGKYEEYQNKIRNKMKV